VPFLSPRLLCPDIYLMYDNSISFFRFFCGIFVPIVSSGWCCDSLFPLSNASCIRFSANMSACFLGSHPVDLKPRPVFECFCEWASWIFNGFFPAFSVMSGGCFSPGCALYYSPLSQPNLQWRVIRERTPLPPQGLSPGLLSSR